jgi:predicted alpha/beta superfamily hydrolase
MKTTTRILILIALFVSNNIKAQSTEIVSDSIYSESLKEQRKFWVKLPDNYNPSASSKYPVLFLLDGFSLQSKLQAVYENYWGHYLPHMILVGISNRENRTRDLTISKIENRRGGPVNFETGGADNFTSFIENELIPYIDKRYKTTNYRTLIGHSYGGLFALNVLLNHKHLFNNYIAIDPSLDWDDQNLFKQAKTKLASESYKGKSLFLSLAAEQLNMQDESITIDNLLQDKSEFSLFGRTIVQFSNLIESHPQSHLNFSWKVYPEDLHGTVPLPTIRDGLVFLFKWYQFKHPQKYNNPETSLQEIEALLSEQSKIYYENLGYSVPPMVEELFNAYGYMNLQMGNPDKAYLFFNKAIEYYPKSANAYDAMSDYYEQKEDYQNALEFVKKAFNLDQRDYLKNKITTLNSKLKN